MKRQTQVPGVRRWFGDDFLELQSETLTAIDALVGAYNKPCVVNGCTVSNGSLTKGFVVLSIQNEDLKIMPFAGATIAVPCYLVAQKAPVNSVYADGISRLSAYQYKAVAQAQAPAAGVSFVKIEANGKCDRLPDVMQDALHRLVTDSEKTAWNAKETPTGAQIKATQAKEDAITTANNYIGQARLEARDYTDARETAVRGLVGQVETGLHSITDSLTRTKAEKTETVISVGAIKENPYEIFHKSQIVYRASGVPGVPGDSGVPGVPGVPGDSGVPGALGVSGTFVQFCTEDHGITLQAHDRSPSFFISNLIPRPKNPIGPPPPDMWETYELLHTGNTPQIVIAGKVNGTTFVPYFGVGCTITLTGSKYTITHRLDTDMYLVNITPIGSTARSFSVVSKSDNDFEVQFSSTTLFEIQILKY